ncbi:MAG: ammonium transporter [Fibrobacterales bacterium]
MKTTLLMIKALLAISVLMTPIFASDTDLASVQNEAYYAIDNLFLFLAAVLVLFMQAGFAMVEAGFNSSKNTVNILFKNLMDMSIGVMLFYVIGYGIMYGDSVLGGFMGFGGFGISMDGPDKIGGGVLHGQIDFFFQAVFAATAATIVSGAVAGRLKFSAYLIYSAILTAFIYPVSGYWKWGGGWLDAMGFMDFAGSLVVHAVGGFAGLAAAIVLGPRIGRFVKGKSKAMPGHNLTLASLGVFILLVGWFGFNPGSQLALAGSDNVNAVALIAVNTLLAAAAGAFSAMALSWILFKKPEISLALNGLLAGLVGITANCDVVTNGESIIIGLVAGVLVIGGIRLLDKLKIDDPVGAFPVHGLCGFWGGVATGIFGTGASFSVQLIGSVVISAWAFAAMFVLFLVLKKLDIMRVSEEEERKGLDICEHGEEAYHGIQYVD